MIKIVNILILFILFSNVYSYNFNLYYNNPNNYVKNKYKFANFPRIKISKIYNISQE